MDGLATDGNDYLSGGGRPTTELFGGGGNDSLYGDAASATITWTAAKPAATSSPGGDGNDIVRGGQGDDIVHGDAGIDQVYGDAGDDLLFGDAGQVALVGSVGAPANEGPTHTATPQFTLTADGVTGTVTLACKSTTANNASPDDLVPEHQRHALAAAGLAAISWHGPRSTGASQLAIVVNAASAAT